MRPTTPTRASCRRSSTCTCRWRSSRCAGSWRAACTGCGSCARATALLDLRSYVAIHISLILAVGALVTGSIWAKASWGHWWVWEEPTLVSFLIVFLLYACYQPLRFSIEDPERQARYAAVFAVIGGAFVPLNFMAVRAAESLTHPRVLSTTGGSMPGSMRLTFLISLVGMALLFVTLNKYELTSKQASFRLRALKRKMAGDDDGWVPVRRSAAPAALMPALPLDDAGPVRRGRLPGLPGADPDLRGDHGRQARRASSGRSASWPSSRSDRERRAEHPRPRRCRDERAARARHLAQDRAAGRARADRAARRPGRGAARRAARAGVHHRGRRALHLQPHRALPRRLRPGRGRVVRARAARAPRRDPPDRADGAACTRCATATPRATCTASRAASSR